MKKCYLPLAILTLLLSACSANGQTLSKVSTPQTVENFTSTNLLTTDTPSNNTTTTDSSETKNEVILTFATQQDFVDYMHKKIVALEDTMSLLDSNLSQLFAVSSTEDSSGYQSIRQSLFDKATDEMELMGTLTLPNTEVQNLHDYVQKAYQYTITAKEAEYEIYNSETLDMRQQLLAANSENERLSAHYIQLSWDEIDRLSNTTIYRK